MIRNENTMKRYARPFSGAPSKGFTLTEVLITVVIMAIGLLGLAGMQANSLKFNHSAYLRSQATNLAYDIVDRMRANRSAALAGAYDIAVGGALPTGTAIADTDLAQWKPALAAELPAGDGSVCRDVDGNLPCSGGGTYIIVSVQWDKSRVRTTVEGIDEEGGDTEMFTMVSRL